MLGVDVAGGVFGDQLVQSDPVESPDPQVEEDSQGLMDLLDLRDRTEIGANRVHLDQREREEMLEGPAPQVCKGCADSKDEEE